MLRTLSTSLVLCFIMGCGNKDGNGNGNGNQNEVPIPPTIVLDSPTAGTFVNTSTVTVSGQVIEGSSPVTTLEYNGEKLDFDANGNFSTTISVEDGINLIELLATDRNEEQGVEGIGFHGGDVREPGQLLESAGMLFLGQNVLDDDDPEPDDLAGIAELLLSGDTLAGSLVGTTLQSDYFTFTPESIEYSRVEVEISPSGDSIWLGVTLYDLWMDYTIVGDTWYWWAEHEGSAWADTVTVWSELEAGSANGGIWVEADNTDVEMENFGLTVEYIPDALEGYLASWTEGTVEETVSETIEEEITELLDEYLSVFEMQFEPLDDVILDLALEEIEVYSGGLNITFNVATYSAAPLTDLPQGAGSLSTDGEAPTWPPANVESIALTVDDDMINQAIFAGWAVRLREGLVMEGDDVASLPIPAPLGPFARVEATVALPPVLTDPVDNETLSGIGLGELDLVMERQDGEVNRLNVGILAGVSIELEDGALSLDLDLGSDTTELAIGVREVASTETEASIRNVAAVMLPVALGFAESYVPEFNLPSYDLSQMGFEELEGVELSFSNLSWERTGNGWFTATGALD